MPATSTNDHFQRIKPCLFKAIQVFGANSLDDHVVEVIRELTLPLRDHVHEYQSDLKNIPPFYRFCYSLSRLVDLVPVENRCGYWGCWYQCKVISPLADQHFQFHSQFDSLPAQVAETPSAQSVNLGEPTSVSSSHLRENKTGKVKKVPASGGITQEIQQLYEIPTSEFLEASQSSSYMPEDNFNALLKDYSALILQTRLLNSMIGYN